MPKYRAKLAYSLLFACIILAFVETVLRIVFNLQGYSVGQLTPNWFPQIPENEQPKLNHSYIADSEGVFKADRDYWAKMGVSINSYGFLGNEWDAMDNSKPKVLLLGDSFVWGAGAEPLSQGFASLLTSNYNANIYNTGIPGADPAQYSFLANKFIPLLQPHITIVFVYMGNDMMEFERELKSYKPLFFVSDLGWFPGYYKGRYFENIDSSFQFYKRMYTPTGFFKSLACKTALGTSLYSLPLRLKERQERRALLKSDITNRYLLNIADLAAANGSRIFIVPIPYLGTDFSKDYQNNPKRYFQTQHSQTFKGLQDYLLVLPLSPENFHPLPNGHFNNEGHQLVAQLIAKTIAIK